MATILCCIAGHRTASSPSVYEPPRSIRLARPEEIELNRIFLTACLPEDHPHAIKIPGRKVPLNADIVQSPTLGNKLRRQLSRHSLPRPKSLQSLRLSAPRLIHRRSRAAKDDLTIEEILIDGPIDQNQYDEDAHSVLVLSRLASSRDDRVEPAERQPSQHHTLLSSFEWLLPQIRSHGTEQTPRHSSHLDDPARPDSSPSVHGNLRRSTSMPEFRSSSPSFRNRQTTPRPDPEQRHVSLPMPLVSTQDRLGSEKPLLALDETNNTTGLSVESWKDVESKRASTQSSLHRLNRHAFVIGSPSDDASGLGPFDGTLETANELQRSVSPVSFHLYNMSISNQLRTQIRPSKEVSLDDSNQAWNHPSGSFSLNSGFIVMSKGSDGRQMSGSISKKAGSRPTDPGRSVRDAASSIYSRSMDQSPYLDSSRHSIIDMPYTITASPERAEPESPLAHRSPNDEAASTLTVQNTPPRPDLNVPASSPNPSPGSAESGMLQVARPSLKSKASSSSSLGKISKFRENLTTSPPVKLFVRKKGSLFNFRMPFRQIRNQQDTVRGNGEVEAQQALMLDGPADHANKLSVPTILRRVSSGATPRSSTSRSVSFVSAQSQRQGGSDATQADVPTPSPLRQDSLADYERSLTVQGDNRRRKSTVNFQNLRDVQQDDRHESIALLTRPIHRAQPLFGPRAGEQSLMEKALQKHQREKAALFRKRDRIPVTHIEGPSPVFSSPFGPSSTPARITSGFEDVDPLSEFETRRVQSMQQLRSTVESPTVQTLKPKASTVTASSKSSRTIPGVKMPPASWCRFPSHLRNFRSGSAGAHDAVMTRDFADNDNDLDAAIHTATNSPATPLNRIRAVFGRKSKPRSATFSHVWRHYTHIFTSGSAQNRRSSVSVGGKLKHPELEILPPLSLEHHHHHPYHGQMDTVSPRARSASNLDRFAARMKAEVHEMEDMMHHRHGQVDKGKGKAKVDVRMDSVATRETGRSENDGPDKAIFLSPSSAALAFDGAAELPAFNEKHSSSPASRLSDMYRQTCVRIPNSLDVAREATPQLEHPLEPRGTDNEVASEDRPDLPIMTESRNPPSAAVSTLPDDASLSATDLNPTKDHSLQEIKVRYFPSVTVIDDKKGHYRSVSLVSVKSGNSASAKNGSVRESTNDLLGLLGKIEEKERMRLQALAEGSCTWRSVS
ncbi:hypothetical protein MBLNU457_3843t1 [Dothideomycetes sp. NU457]